MKTFFYFLLLFFGFGLFLYVLLFNPEDIEPTLPAIIPEERLNVNQQPSQIPSFVNEEKKSAHCEGYQLQHPLDPSLIYSLEP